MQDEQSPKTIRVLVVDDSFFMRRIIVDMLRRHPEIKVVGQASNGKEAIAAVAKLQPDVVTMDIEMPVMNGVEALEAIVAQEGHPAVVMLTGHSEAGVDVTLECLSRGAADFILKPSGPFSLNLGQVHDELIARVKAAAEVQPVSIQSSGGAAQQSPEYRTQGGIIVFGASTGGPLALEAILPDLPPSLPYPVVIAQHLPTAFTRSFTERLRKKCKLAVVQAAEGMELKAGTIYVAGGGANTTVQLSSGQHRLHITSEDSGLETPSINQLMTSAAETYTNKAIGIIMTGMGRDGLMGMQRIRELGGRTIVQDQGSSAVFGMGKVVTEQGLAEFTVPLNKIVETIHSLLAAPHG